MKGINYGRFISVYQSQDGGYVLYHLGDFGASGTPSDDEVEVESSSFVGDNAGDCGLWDLGGDGGLYSGGGELK